MALGWFLSFIVLLVIELLTVNLVSIWFAVGAIAAMVCCFFTDSIIVQLAVFLLTSFVALLIMKPILKKVKVFDVTPTNLDRVVGKIGEVTKMIEPDKYGEVKIFGNLWSAASDSVIAKGEKVRILSIDGVKLIVQKEEK